MNSDENQMLAGLVNSTSRLFRQIEDNCDVLQNFNGENIDYDMSGLETSVHNLINNFKRLEGAYTAAHALESLEYDILLAILPSNSNSRADELKFRQNSIDVLAKLTHTISGWNAELERLEEKMAGLRASKRRRICRNNDDDDPEGAGGKSRQVERTVLKKILSTLGW